uniref:Uncharacterized protein n=1 Tax=Oryza barthii TaxID=65489 RepID=A0A0D3GEI5_9ORYZ
MSKSHSSRRSRCARSSDGSMLHSFFCKIQTWQLVFLNLPAIHLHSPHIWRSLSCLQRFSPSALSCRHLRLQAQLVWRHRRAPLDLHASTVWWSLEVVDPKGKSYYSNEEDIRLVCVLYPS